MAQRTQSESGQTRASTTGRGDTKEAEVQRFFDRLARSLTAGDGRAVAAMWETPALVVGDQMLRAVSSATELEQFFGGAKGQYNERGITDTRADIVELDWPTERIAIAEVRWPYLDARGNEVGEETSTYTLRRNDAGELKLCAAIMHGAAEPH